MRIVAIELAGRGGMIHYTFQLCRALAAAGADLTLVTDRHYELDRLAATFRVAKLLRLWDPKPGADERSRWLRAPRRAARALIYCRAWLRLARFLRRARPDWVLLGDLRFAGDVVCVQVLRALGLRLACVCHNVLPLAGGGQRAGLFRDDRATRALYRAIYRRMDAVFVHFATNRQALLETYGLPQGRVIEIPHGHQAIFAELRAAGVDGAALRARLGLAPGAPVVLFFGTLSRYKGLDLLLEGFARVRRRVPSARLVVAGFPAPDFDRAAFVAVAERRGVADALVLHARYVPAEEVAAWMELASVVVFPYRAVWQSGALVLAQTLGAPLVATAVGAIPDMVRDGETGLLVPPGDPEALAAAIESLLADPDLAGRLGCRAAEEARARFAWEGVASTVLATLREPSLPAAVEGRGA